MINQFSSTVNELELKVNTLEADLQDRDDFIVVLEERVMNKDKELQSVKK